ncbi:MAG: hypothetical protein JWO82_3350 [Akkermansiaceae bacterium]|nr:hypothetical protein [Akkermansiaceae bacterium]
MEKDRPGSVTSSTEHLVGKLAAADLPALAPFRAHPQWLLRADVDTAFFWLKVPPADAELFATLPLHGRWTATPDHRLIRTGRRVPEALLPDDGWSALDAHLPLGVPLRGAPGMPPSPVPFQLIPATAETPATALLARLEDLAAWADTALAARLAPLHFAASADGRVFITGEPLPAIPGTAFHPRGRLFLPAGFDLPAHVWPALLEEGLGLGASRLAILHPNGTHEEMDRENLIPATRAAIRATHAANPPPLLLS